MKATRPDPTSTPRPGRRKCCSTGPASRPAPDCSKSAAATAGCCAAAGRGARAWGITVSQPQVRHTTRAGLNVRLLDYKHLRAEWDGQFDAIIANGSLEHFAQPTDAAAGRDDAIYRHLFATAHRLLAPADGPGRFVTTAIHIRHRPDPNDWLRRPSAFPYGSAAFHW